VLAIATSLLLFLSATAEGQFFAECFDGSVDEFERSITSHNEHTYRLYHKFQRDYYFWGQLPEHFESGSLEDVRRFIADLPPRRAGVLFYGLNTDVRPNRLCSWLVGPSGQIYYRHPRPES
jgi:hypothetical protein